MIRKSDFETFLEGKIIGHFLFLLIYTPWIIVKGTYSGYVYSKPIKSDIFRLSRGKLSSINFNSIRRAMALNFYLKNYSLQVIAKELGIKNLINPFF
ncbi:hypothetical protein M3226_26630 [Neobacillus cucumis]|uniref:hypothetical protein n=1 Tax=Neobacillus cucumis TaxID=1740721 RepID=UPI00203F4BC1|nr:hypothetical protein [Neobacillus cucumis]MCM3729189.1 hypothetical protein [Neobacillus cucumis]